MPLNDQIIFRCTFDTLHGDKEGNVFVKLELPASEAAKAAMLLVMRDIVFEAKLTPVDVNAREGGV